MKKLAYILTLIIILSGKSYSQGNIFFTFDYSKQVYDYKSSQMVDMYSINMEIFFTENISINYSTGLGFGNDGVFFHAPAGAFGGWNMLLYSLENDDDIYIDEEEETNWLAVPAVLLMILPEGINYYFNLSQYISLGAYMNPFKYNYYRDWGSMSSSIGLKAAFYLEENFVIIPHLEMTSIWQYGAVPSFGVSAGFKF